jgi:hypothetical protein
MRHVRVWVGLCLLASAARSEAIINGTPVAQGESLANGLIRILHPHSSVNNCSGTLVSNQWVLTARHCTVGVSADRLQFFLSNSTTRPEVGERIVGHDDVDIDIALVRLRTSLYAAGSQNLNFERLWFGSREELIGSDQTCYGYGRSVANSSGSARTLRKATMRTRVDGNIWFSGYIVDQNAQGQIVAPGDSGGPCFRDLGGFRYLTGVMKSGDPGVGYVTEAAKFRAWMTRTMFSAPQNLGGTSATGSAMARSHDPGSEWTVAVNMASQVQIRQKFWGTSWGGWEGLGAPPTGITSDPAVAYRPDGNWRTLDVFVRGGESGIWSRTRLNGSWGGWQFVGGSCSSGPGVAPGWGNGRMDLFCMTGDGALWQKVHEYGQWGGWFLLGRPPGGGVSWDQPTAVWKNPNELYVYVRGNDLAAWQISFIGWWTGWTSHGGAFLRTPTVTGRGRPNLFLYGVGMNCRLFTKVFTGAGNASIVGPTWWPGWEMIDKGVVYGSNVAAVHHSSDDFVDVVGVADNGTVRFISRPW